MFDSAWQDSGSNTYHTLNREYSPTQGRWLTPDPSGLAAVDPSNPQTWNRYVYVTNNPISFTDPTGLVRTPWGIFGGNVAFGGTWNEFVVMNIPIVTKAWGWTPVNPNDPSSLPMTSPNGNVTNLAYWGQISSPVGTGFDLLSSYCALFCGADGNGVFDRLYPLRPTVASVTTLAPSDLGNLAGACLIDAVNANNGFGDSGGLVGPTASDSVGTGVTQYVEFADQNGKFQGAMPLNPSAAPESEAAMALAPPEVFVQGSYQNCLASHGIK